MNKNMLERQQRIHGLEKENIGWSGYQQTWFEAVLDEGKPKIRIHNRSHQAFMLIGVMVTDFEITVNPEAANTNYAWDLTREIVETLNTKAKT